MSHRGVTVSTRRLAVAAWVCVAALLAVAGLAATGIITWWAVWIPPPLLMVLGIWLGWTARSRRSLL